MRSRSYGKTPPLPMDRILPQAKSLTAKLEKVRKTSNCATLSVAIPQSFEMANELKIEKKSGDLGGCSPRTAARAHSSQNRSSPAYGLSASRDALALATGPIARRFLGRTPKASSEALETACGHLSGSPSHRCERIYLPLLGQRRQSEHTASASSIRSHPFCRLIA